MRVVPQDLVFLAAFRGDPVDVVLEYSGGGPAGPAVDP
jgi:hypothetical protein